MANKPLNISSHPVRVSAQGSPRPVVVVEFESLPQIVPADELVDVRGSSVVGVYNATGGAAVASASPDGSDSSSLALLDKSGSAVSVATVSAQTVDVKGIAFISFNAQVTLIAAG